MTTESIIALIGMSVCAVIIVCLVRLSIETAHREREAKKKVNHE